jgi:hypothetical protein
MAHEQHEAGHEHHHHEEGAGAATSLHFIVAELSATEALVRYDCPCGCRPATEYEKDAADSEYEQCCCGNVHFVGPNAKADLDSYLASRGGVGAFTVKEEALTAPWGGTIAVAYAMPHVSLEH